MDGDKSNIHLFNVLGKEQKFEVKTWNRQEFTIDISNLANGIYFLQTSQKTIKIIKR